MSEIISADAASITAASLVQAEMAARGIGAPTKGIVAMRTAVDYKAVVADAYRAYLHLVQTGSLPTKE